jgi:hypothetical protein
MAAPNATLTADPKTNRTPAALENTTGAANKAVRWLLRSPLHGLLSYRLMLVTYAGRKSGKTYTTPVTYIKSPEGVLFFTNRPWWHNFEARSPVTLRVKGRDLHGVAQAVTDPYEIEPIVRTYLEEKGVRSAWMIGLKLKAKTIPNRDELARTIADWGTTMVRVRPTRHARIGV